MIYRVRHRTTYSYSERVLVAHHMAHLTPRETPWQTCRRSHLKILPAPIDLTEDGIDYFGNPVCFFSLQDPHRGLTVDATSRVELKSRPPIEPQLSPAWEEVAAMLAHGHGPDIVDAVEFCFESAVVPLLDPVRDYALPSFPPGRPLAEGVLDLMHRIYREFTFDVTATTVSTPVKTVLTDRRGVCQDFAHLGLAALRSLGLAARYVSGYLLTAPPPGKTKLKGSDASHAWLSVFVPGSGWLDIDPTNDCIPDLGHVTTAWGRDYDDVSPIRGVMLGGGSHSLKVGVDVEPIGK